MIPCEYFGRLLAQWNTSGMVQKQLSHSSFTITDQILIKVNHMAHIVLQPYRHLSLALI